MTSLNKIEAIFNDYEEKINALNKMLDENAEEPEKHDVDEIIDTMHDLLETRNEAGSVHEVIEDSLMVLKKYDSRFHDLHENKFKAVFNKYVNR